MLDIRFKEYTAYLDKVEERAKALRVYALGGPLNLQPPAQNSVFSFVSSMGLVRASDIALNHEIAYMNAIDEANEKGLKGEEREAYLEPVQRRLRRANVALAGHMRHQLGFQPRGVRWLIEQRNDRWAARGNQTWILEGD